MRLLIALAAMLILHAADTSKTEAPTPLTDAEKSQILQLKLEASKIETEFERLGARMNELRNSWQQKQQQLSQTVQGLAVKHKAAEYDLGEDLSWKKRPPATAQNNPEKK